ncbi:MAG: ankyrin repeat domain-containing protein [Armatimonadetes bacterium]|nr:ankyrin repeat domain-containing protein [Armatimonadota bacterium]MDE2205947.1 ankyrin repeat domain-containing protein [Armatimonadota bacterium]
MTDERPPRLNAELVEEFVGVSHGRLERVTEILAEAPAIVNAAWDWGAGDWETALGAASHMGRRDIAEVLLSSGARMDVFAAAMLNRVDIVRAMIDADPATAALLGPHGIPLAVHAEMGGAAEVLAFLRSR